MDIFDKIVEAYRDELVFYCMARMKRGYHAAEDVVQEVFLQLHKKRNVDLHGNIRAWLYRTADHKIKEYLRKNPELDDLTEAAAQPDRRQSIDDNSVLTELTEDERTLLERYYLVGEDKLKLAKEYGLSLNALYIRIVRIRHKLAER